MKRRRSTLPRAFASFLAATLAFSQFSTMAYANPLPDYEQAEIWAEAQAENAFSEIEIPESFNNTSEQIENVNPLEEAQSGNELISSIIQQLKSNVPEQQEYLKSLSTFEDQNPEEWVSSPEGSSYNKQNGVMTLNLKAVSTYVSNKTPYLQDGIYSMEFSHNSDNERIGFLIKANSRQQGLAIKYDITQENQKGLWVIQAPGSESYKTFEGPALERGTLYNISIAFVDDRLTIVLDDEIIFNEVSPQLAAIKEEVGQAGFFKWYRDGSMTIDNMNYEGYGYNREPEVEEEEITYFKDYEDENPGEWLAGANATVVDLGGGNKALKVTGVGRFMDAASPDITNGSLSFDYMTSSAERFGFGFRRPGNGTANYELNWDGGKWVVESSGGYPGIDGVPAPVANQWHKVTINFKDNKLRVFYDNELVTDWEEFGILSASPGKFGYRIWGSSKSLYFDNVEYTSKIVEPYIPQYYEADFQNNVTGSWDGAQPSIARESLNRILKLSLTKNVAFTTSDYIPEISEGTYKLRFKGSITNAGPVFATDEENYKAIYHDGTKWILNQNGTKYELENSENTLKAGVWNDIAVKFTKTSAAILINGIEVGAWEDLLETTGRFGFYGTGDVLIDDVIYTEKDLEITPGDSSDRKFYEEQFLTGTPNWTGLENVTTEDGYLKGSINSEVVAIDENSPKTGSGAFVVKVASSEPEIGIAYNLTEENEICVYHDGNGTWKVSQNGTEQILAENSVVIEPSKSYVIRVQQLGIGNVAIVKVNNKTIGTFETEEIVEGKVGIVNASNKKANVSIDMISSYELLSYTSDYTTLNWANTRIGTTGVEPTVVTDEQDNSAKATGQVATFIDNDSPMIANVQGELEFKPSVDTTLAGGGRYGIILKAQSSSEYIGIAHDINGIWYVHKDGTNTIATFPEKYSIEKDTYAKIEFKVLGDSISLWVDGNFLGTVSAVIGDSSGRFGLKSWYNQKTINVKNVKLQELDPVLTDQIEVNEINLVNGNMTVVTDQAYPRVIRYEAGGKVLDGQVDGIYNVNINNSSYVPEVSFNKVGEATGEYTMTFDELDTVIKSTITVNDDNTVDIKITDIQENGSFKVQTIELPGSLLSVDSSSQDATYAFTRFNGNAVLGGKPSATNDLVEEIVDDLYNIPRTAIDGATIAMISGNGLVGSIETNVYSGGKRLKVSKTKTSGYQKVEIANGVWTYRQYPEATISGLEAGVEHLPWCKIIVTDEDANNDEKMDWQDAAVAYRKIMTPVFGGEQMKNNMMYISFNFASQANDPFLNGLDTGKVLYNYTDGFGQLILSKGYQMEGHDDSIPDYEKIGVRPGGAKDFNYLIDEGKKYNLKIGVHINATEYMTDAFNLRYDNLSGSEQGTLSRGWGWVDQAFHVDKTKDIRTGELVRRLKALKDTAPGLNFYYVDVYYGNDYNAHYLVDAINDLGLVIATEFAGPIEPGVAFVHWGPDLGYPNEGNWSKLHRFVKNDLDLFSGHALLKGAKIAGVTTWNDVHPNLKAGVLTFYNEVLPTKYMQHHNIIKMETDKITFDGNVTSERNSQTRNVELRKEGKLISYWADTGTIIDPSELHVSPATSLIPWNWDIETNEELAIGEGKKLYHWNPNGGTTTWELTSDFEGVTSFDVYELSGTDKKKINTVNVVDGKVTLTAQKEVGYALYPAGAKAPEVASNWGEGSAVEDFAFNSMNFETWNKSSTGDSSLITVVRDEEPMGGNRKSGGMPWNNYLKVGTTDAVVSQEINGLESGKDYSLSVWARVDAGREAKLKFEIDGKIYEKALTDATVTHGSSFKYLGTKYQRLIVKFNVPKGITAGKVSLIASGGSGEVRFDDVKLWKHLIVDPDLHKADYVVYEDFENVTEGWGPFERTYIGGAYMTHLSERDPRGLVAKDSKVAGQNTTWVRDGDWSLRTHESATGIQYMTVEPTLKLKPNTKYEMGMLYSLESNANYAINVFSRSSLQSNRWASDVLFQDTLEKVSNEQGGTSYVKTFTTGSKTDYAVGLARLIAVPDGTPLDTLSMTMDNFYIKEIKEDTPQEVNVSPNKNAVYPGKKVVLLAAPSNFEDSSKVYKWFSNDKPENFGGQLISESRNRLEFETPRTLSGESQTYYFYCEVNGVASSVSTIIVNDPVENNAALDSIVVDNGNISPAFSPSVYEYNVSLPGGTTEIPHISAKAADYVNANVEITQATSLPGAATVKVTNGNNVKTYTVNLAVVQETYTVTFVDHKGGVLSTQTVMKGASAKPPVVPERKGYEHLDWEGQYRNVTKNETVTAKYVKVSNTTEIAIEPVSGMRGEIINIKVNLSGNSGISGLRFAINFDKAKVTPVSVEGHGDFAKGFESNVRDPKTNLAELEKVTYVWGNHINTLEEGGIATFKFRINSSLAEDITSIPLTISFEEGDISDENGENVEIELSNGIITVLEGEAILYGDVYRDGAIDSRDLTHLLKYLAKRVELTPYEKSAADVFKNGEIDTNDLVKLLQYLANWDVTLGTPDPGENPNIN